MATKRKTTDTTVRTFSQCRIAGFLELDPAAQRYYRRKCEELMAVGLLRTTHLQQLLLWADCYARYWQLRDEIAAEGATFRTHNRAGDLVFSANPKVKMMNDALKQANLIATDFGLTPKAAKRLKSEEVRQQKTPLEMFEEGSDD